MKPGTEANGRCMTTLQEVQATAGATFMTVADQTVPQQFGQDAAARQAIAAGVALCDRSHWGRLRVGGGDRLRFLHNQTTHAMEPLQPGQSCDTVFVTSTARTIDLVSAYVLEDHVCLLTSPGYGSKLMQWMDRFIFFADKVDLADLTEATACFSIMGPDSDRLLQQVGLAIAPPHTHTQTEINGMTVRVAAGSGLATPGYTLICDRDQGADLWQQLTGAGAIPFGQDLWESLRIQQGRPMPDQELTEDYNPLEAGLWHRISFSKGCYIGQETIARLDTYKGVKQQLWGIRLSEQVEPGTALTVDDTKVGLLTSVTPAESGAIGLAYLRTKAGGPGLTVQVGTAQGEILDVPFLTRERSPLN